MRIKRQFPNRPLTLSPSFTELINPTIPEIPELTTIKTAAIAL
jgi:hypothetical protein